MDSRHPKAELKIDEKLVRVLLLQQHPDLASEPLALVGSGWDNVIYRVGCALAVRLPRRQTAVELLHNEQRWLPILAQPLRVRVPDIVRSGVPSASFPWPWSVVKWISGTTADDCHLAPSEAARLAQILRCLHREAPIAAPVNPYRGVPLRTREKFVRQNLIRVGGMPATQVQALQEAWSAGVIAPKAEQRVWLHSDLHPRNLIVARGRLAGIIDWGGLTAGDRATDLACAWMLFVSVRTRERFWQVYQPSDSTKVRARSWAVLFGSALATSGEPRHVRIGIATLKNLLGGVD